MSRQGTNPVLEPIRSWVLWSKTRLACTIVGTIAALVLAGNVFGSDDEDSGAATTAAATESSTSASPSATDEYRVPVEEAGSTATNQALDPSSAREAPDTAAEGWVNAWYDSGPSDNAWKKALTEWALPGVVTDTITGARPDTDGEQVVVDGYIRIEYVDNELSSSASSSVPETGSTNQEDRPAGGGGSADAPAGNAPSDVPTDSGDAAPPFSSARPTAPTLRPSAPERTESQSPAAPSAPERTPSQGPEPSSEPVPSRLAPPPDVTGRQIVHGSQHKGSTPRVQLAQYGSNDGTEIQAIAHVPLSNGDTLKINLSEYHDGWRVASPLPTKGA